MYLIHAVIKPKDKFKHIPLTEEDKSNYTQRKTERKETETVHPSAFVFKPSI